MTANISPLAMTSPPTDAPRVVALKQRIGYDAALATERTDEQVALDLHSLPVPDALSDWALERQVDKIADDEAELQMRFKRGDGVVTIKLTLFAPRERQRVASKLINRANAVTRAEITLTRGPVDLGTLSLTRESGGNVYWIFRNVYAEVVVYRASVDKLLVARSVQHHLQASLRPA